MLLLTTAGTSLLIVGKVILGALAGSLPERPCGRASFRRWEAGDRQGNDIAILVVCGVSEWTIRVKQPELVAPERSQLVV